MRPSVGARKPEIIANSVVLPAPFGPISAVIRPVSAANDARSTASRPPKRFETFSTRKIGSVSGSLMAALHRRQPGADPVVQVARVGEQADDAARRKRH